MKIGIVGAGEIGAALAKNFTRIGHSVKIANSRGTDTLADVAARTGATPAELTDVVKDVDLVVLTIPFGKITTLPNSFFAQLPAEAVLVETGNYSPGVRDDHNDAIEAGLTETRWISDYFGRLTIKAFNNLIAKELESRGRPEGDPERIAIPIAGDDAKAKAIVMDLVETIGFDAVDGGSADESWRQQLGSPVSNASTLDKASLIEGLAKVDQEQVRIGRDKLLELYRTGVINPH